MRKKIFISLLISLLFLTSNVKNSFAQDNPDYPVYVVQSGETLTLIAIKFNTTVDEIISINGIVNADLISEGTELYIPGLEGITGRLVTHAINLGESIEDLSIANHISLETLLFLNKITSPNEIYVGTNIIIPVADETASLSVARTVQSQDTLIETAVLQQSNPWVLLQQNDLRTGNTLIVNTPVFAEIDSAQTISTISPLIRNVDISPLPLVQGTTIVVKVETTEPIDLTGTLDDHTLHFFPYTDKSNTYYAIQGIHAMAETGLVSFNLTGSSQGTPIFSYDQMLLQQAGTFVQDPPLYVQDETVDPAITGPEEDLVRSYTTQVSTEKYWQGSFQYPVDGSVENDTIGFMSTYGNRRSYNGSDYTYFHTGLDFGVYTNSLNIYAAESGVVVYTGLLTVRGNATFIDHGQGIFSGYFHQAEILVNVGDHVEKGQLIGHIGATGRVTGPHLHWEIWANGVQVNPVDWVLNTYP
ncbi:MAG: peptidoglycan DD-metalloendopeptidase family protein [Anaerolineaceae bacterium]